MPFVNLPGLGDAKEGKAVPESRRPLTVDNVKSYESDKGRHILQITHRIDDADDDVLPVTIWLGHPKEDDDARTAKFMLLQLKRYFYMANVPFEADGYNEEDLYGASFEANLTLVENEETGEKYNNIVLPRLPDEG